MKAVLRDSQMYKTICEWSPIAQLIKLHYF
jgi:hypothetical protein